MPIALKYTVHSVATDRAPVRAEVNGQSVEAHVDRLVIELTADDGDHGHTFRLPIVSDEALTAQREGFAVGTLVTLTIEPGALA